MRLGQSGASFLPPLHNVRYVVEQRSLSRDLPRWVRVGGHYTEHEEAAEEASGLRRQGFTVRVRPLVLL